MRVRWNFFLVILCALVLCGCEKHSVIVNDIAEREANEILVFLASRGIRASKQPSTTSNAPGADSSAGAMWSIAVGEKEVIDAMAILNRNGLPRRKAPTLLELFSKQGLISSQSEENIRYQAGLAAQIAGTIRKIDGVIDADVELSIPTDEGSMPGEGAVKRRITAAVYVKHQGILDDPNSHLVTKIKRLVSGSISGLDINDVTVISDRSRFTDITVEEINQDMTMGGQDYVSIWSIVMSKGSMSRFRFLFFILIAAMITFALLVGWLIWKFYPILRQKGMKTFFSPAPFEQGTPAPSSELKEPRDIQPPS